MFSVLLPYYRDRAETLAEAASSVLSDMDDEDELVLVDAWRRCLVSSSAGASIGKIRAFTDPRLSFDALRRLRAEHLARRIDRPFAIWGAGATGRRLARELETHDARASLFIDIDPRKVGRAGRGAPILSVAYGLARVRGENLLVIVAVAAFGARDLARERLAETGFVEGRDFICAA